MTSTWAPGRSRRNARDPHLTQARTAEKQRVEKLLEDGHLKLSSVISDIHGVSGRDMLDGLAAGQRDPKALAQLARGTMRGKIRRLEALECSFFTGQHAAVLSVMLTTIDHYTTQIGQLTAKIEALAEPYLHQITQLDAVPGIGVVCAQDIIAEIGTDMTAFPTASHLVSWARWSPQVKQSAGKRKGSNATGRGNPCLGAALGEATISTGRTQSFPGAKYRRLARRMPKKKALVAAARIPITGQLRHASTAWRERASRAIDGTGWVAGRRSSSKCCLLPAACHSRRPAFRTGQAPRLTFRASGCGLSGIR